MNKNWGRNIKNIKQKLNPYFVKEQRWGELIFLIYQFQKTIVTIMETTKTPFEKAGILKIAIHKDGRMIEESSEDFNKNLLQLYKEIGN